MQNDGRHFLKFPKNHKKNKNLRTINAVRIDDIDEIDECIMVSSCYDAKTKNIGFLSYRRLFQAKCGLYTICVAYFCVSLGRALWAPMGPVRLHIPPRSSQLTTITHFEDLTPDRPPERDTLPPYLLIDPLILTIVTHFEDPTPPF